MGAGSVQKESLPPVVPSRSQATFFQAYPAKAHEDYGSTTASSNGINSRTGPDISPSQALYLIYRQWLTSGSGRSRF